VIFHASLEMKNLDHDKQSKNKEIIVSIRHKCLDLQYFVEDPLHIHKVTVLDECIVKGRGRLRPEIGPPSELGFTRSKL
jgi:hypothetical protein